MIKPLLTTCFVAFALAGCSRKVAQILPDEGPTTVQIIEGDYTKGGRITTDNFYPTEAYPIIGTHRAQSMITGSHLNELDQDFKEVPNPKILGYVYPHFNSAEMPVPGYFTSFRLYKQNHYALMDEGAAEGWTK